MFGVDVEAILDNLRREAGEKNGRSEKDSPSRNQRDPHSFRLCHRDTPPAQGDTGESSDAIGDLCKFNDIRLLTGWAQGCYSYHESEKYFEPALCCNGRADRQWVAKTACLREPMFVGLYSSLFRLLVASEGFFYTTR